MSPPGALRRDAVVQSVVGSDHVALTSSLDGSERIYAIGVSDAYTTLLMPISSDAAATSVGTRALIDAISCGRARRCSVLVRDNVTSASS